MSTQHANASLQHSAANEGLRQDLRSFRAAQLSRRLSLHWLASAIAMPLIGCGGSSSTANAAPGSGAGGGNSSGSSCSAIPSETSGPFPGDGTNTAPGGTSNVLLLAGLKRSDITASLAGYGSSVAAGVPLTLNLELKSLSSGCATGLADYAVYLWHCDALGRYSLYSSGVTAETYLRGLQVTDSSGKLSFSTIFPGCYPGRWPHMHFEIFTTLAAATSGSASAKISQLALPQGNCAEVYADSRYSGSATNLAALSLARDGIFSDGVSQQMASVTGSVSTGYVANLSVYL